MKQKFTIKVSGVAGMNDFGPIDLTKGITTFTGRNNVGKSRILRKVEGIRRILENQLDSSRLEVTMEYNVGDETKTVLIETDGTTGMINIFTPTGQRNILRLSVQRGGSVKSYNEDGNPQMSGGGGSILSNLNYFPEFSRIKENLERIIYMPPYRPIAEKSLTQLQVTIDPSGNNLGQVIYYNKNSDTPQMHEIEKVMNSIFPEIGQILTVPIGDNLISLSFEDKYSGTIVPLYEAGTGVAQILFIVAMVTCSEPGRIFLIDEPHVYLHPQAEKELARFFREHNEHSYLIATHSPLLISQLKPDISYLVTRDKAGTKIRPVFNSSEDRDNVFRELGVKYGDIILFENIIFVEGRSDELIYDILLRKLGFTDILKSTVIVNISGSGASEQLEGIMKRVDKVLNIPHITILDGDQRGKKKGDNIKFIPYPDLEYVLLSDPNALLYRIKELKKSIDSSAEEWNLDRIQSIINNGKQRKLTGAAILEEIYQNVDKDCHYNKVTEGPLIAEQIDPDELADLRDFFKGLQ